MSTLNKGNTMRKSIFMILSLVLLLTQTQCDKDDKNPVDDDTDKIEEPQGWRLVWNDEFSASTIDPMKWVHEVNAHGGGNNELQYYTARPENSFIEDGALIIQALKERYTGPEGTREFTSARLRTKNKGDWKYGRFDIRAKLPYSQGIWPAIWMMPTESIYGGWPACGEIDIVELMGHEPNKVYGTLHYGGDWPEHVHTGDSYVLPSGLFSDDFHLFTLEWEAQAFRWYIDGVFYQSQSEWFTTNGEYPAPFDQLFYLILNVAVGGNWPGDPNETTIFPQQMRIDYVRVFEKK